MAAMSHEEWVAALFGEEDEENHADNSVGSRDMGGNNAGTQDIGPTPAESVNPRQDLVRLAHDLHIDPTTNEPIPTYQQRTASRWGQGCPKPAIAMLLWDKARSLPASTPFDTSLKQGDVGRTIAFPVYKNHKPNGLREGVIKKLTFSKGTIKVDFADYNGLTLDSSSAYLVF